MNLTGTWEGHYFHNWITGALVAMDESSEWAFPIRLHLTDEDSKLTGSMIDLRNEWQIGIKEYVEHLVPTLNWQDRMEYKRFLADNPISVLKVQLPRDSQIEGGIKGSNVTFTKTYDGTSSSTWVFGSQEVTTKDKSFPVNYFGLVNAEGDLITGKFAVIQRNSEASQNHGQFQLRKVS